MAFALGPPFFEIWLADMESLGPGRTLKEHYQANVERLTRLIETDPEDSRYYLGRAGYNVYLGDRMAVLEDLQKYVDLDDASSSGAEAYADMAWFFVARHQEMVDPEITLQLCRKVDKLQPEAWRHLCGLGAAYYRTGQWEEAIAVLEASIKKPDGSNGFNYLFLAMAHQQLGNEAEAQAWYNKAMEWIEDSNNNWLNVQDRAMYDIYLEASELMRIETR
jgi:tetratricopeptide (TPR) repeat protein